MTQVTECYDLRWTRGALSILCWLSMAASGQTWAGPRSVAF